MISSWIIKKLGLVKPAIQFAVGVGASLLATESRSDSILCPCNESPYAAGRQSAVAQQTGGRRQWMADSMCLWERSPGRDDSEWGLSGLDRPKAQQTCHSAVTHYYWHSGSRPAGGTHRRTQRCRTIRKCLQSQQ